MGAIWRPLKRFPCSAGSAGPLCHCLVISLFIGLFILPPLARLFRPYQAFCNSSYYFSLVPTNSQSQPLIQAMIFCASVDVKLDCLTSIFRSIIQNIAPPPQAVRWLLGHWRFTFACCHITSHL